MTERVLNLVTYIQWEKPQIIEYDKICNGLKALSEILSIYSYIIMNIMLYLLFNGDKYQRDSVCVSSLFFIAFVLFVRNACAKGAI